MDATLNLYQRERLMIVLRDLEHDLRQSDSWLQGEVPRGTLYRCSLPLPPEATSAARRLVESALSEISQLVGAFGL